MVKSCVFSDVIKTLELLNVCQRCVLRFIGEKAYTSYVTKLSVQKAVEISQSNLTNDVQDVKISSVRVQVKSEEDVCPESKRYNPTPVTVQNRVLVQVKSEEDVCPASNRYNPTPVTVQNRVLVQVKSEEDVYPASKRYNPTPCAACLGILQDSCDEMVIKVETAVKESGYQFDDFVLQLSIPVAVDLRQHLFLLYIKEKFGDIYGETKKVIPSVKDVWKWVVGSQFGKSTKSDFKPSSDFQISISVVYPDTINECLKLFECHPEAFPNRKNKRAKLEDIYTRTAVLKAMEAISSNLKDMYELPPSPPDRHCIYDKIQCSHSPLYLGGRYNKYSRQLSQTPWFVDGERRMDSSVNELITDIVQKWIIGDRIIFSASGREDVDVKMLGSGRPFVLEILNPRQVKWTYEEMKNMENEINNSTTAIAVRDLKVITKKDTLFLKEGEEQKRKSYSAHCFVEKVLCQDDLDKLLAIKDLCLKQKTPLRVLHRRTLATREKMLHSIEAKIVDDHHLELKMETQAGTYVKEFVHGDFGRTTPSLGMLLGTKADILELDVESIHLDWPPKLTS